MIFSAFGHGLGGFPTSKYPPNVLVDGIRAYWVPDEWAQARNPQTLSTQKIKPEIPNSSNQCWLPSNYKNCTVWEVSGNTETPTSLANKGSYHASSCYNFRTVPE